MTLLVTNLVLPDGDPTGAIAARLGIPAPDILDVELVKKALDARTRPPTWRANYRVVLRSEIASFPPFPAGVRAWTPRDEERRGGAGAAGAAAPAPASAPAVGAPGAAGKKVVVVGAGPAGLFAALRLVEGGVAVEVLERGGAVDARVRAVNGHWRGGAFDPENNILYGEGGAGTFSDGKIYTRRRDGLLGYVFRVLVECGADASILDESYAHLGTDRVRAILPVLRERLQRAGAVVHFGVRVERLLVHDGRCVGVATGAGEVLADAVILAVGHSARDTLAMALAAGAAGEARPIAVGARVEHPQALVDRARYRLQEEAGRGDLPAASYRLAHNRQGHPSAFTFCMCPGGMVVPAYSEPGQVVVNGMSFAARRSTWANSAVVVQVPTSAYGGADPLGGARWQEGIERGAFAVGGGPAPAQRVDDFLVDRESGELPRVSYPLGVVAADLRAVLPPEVVAGMKEAIRAFDRELPGFASAAGVLLAPETRTTSPLRLLRSASGESTTLPGLYPAGEGAGWAGGIASAALDGVRIADYLKTSE